MENCKANIVSNSSLEDHNSAPMVAENGELQYLIHVARDIPVLSWPGRL
jgi:hypothetical protein